MGNPLKAAYARWMYRWETRLTNEDSNRIVRPLEWGFDWLADWDPLAAELAAREAAGIAIPLAEAEQAMRTINQRISDHGEDFFGYQVPQDFELEQRYPALFPTNVRPKTLANDAEWKRKAESGEIKQAPFLRFTSPVRTKFPENDHVNARWFPAPAEKQQGKPKQAISSCRSGMPTPSATTSLCEIFNKFGVSALRLSKPYHDIRRPAASGTQRLRDEHQRRPHHRQHCRQAVVDIRCCLDWLQSARL